MSKKENKELAKKRRLEERKAAERKALLTKVGVACAAVLVIGGIVAAVAVSSKKSADEAAADTASQQQTEATQEDAQSADAAAAQSGAGELDSTKGLEVKEGDTVAIDYVGKKDGKAFDGGTGSYDLTIGSHSFIEGFEEGLIGKKVGETVDLNLTFPENYQAADLAGQDVVFTVTINGIYK